MKIQINKANHIVKCWLFFGGETLNNLSYLLRVRLCLVVSALVLSLGCADAERYNSYLVNRGS